MREARCLSETFVASHPAEAARVMEALPAAESAAYLSTLPVRLAAAIVRHLAPPYAALCAETMDPRTLTALSEVLGPQPTAALLQHLPPNAQAQALDRLPVGVAVAARLLIGYPQETAGAWMDPWPLALAAETAAGDALDQLKRYQGATEDVVFVVEEEKRVIGVVTAARLLRSSPRESLSRIMLRPAPSISALTSLAAAREHAGWLEAAVLAVVERQDRLVGALRRQTLAAALPKLRNEASSAATGGTLGVVSSAYWQSVAALAQLAVSLLPKVAPLDRKEDGNER